MQIYSSLAAILAVSSLVSAAPTKVTTAVSVIPDKSLSKRRYQWGIDWTSRWLGTDTEDADFFDDRDLVLERGGDRRLQRMDVWCGLFGVYQIIPYYQNLPGHGAPDEMGDQHGTNKRNGQWQQMKLGPDEWITYVKMSTCKFPDLPQRLCYLELRKSRKHSAEVKPDDTLMCGLDVPNGEFPFQCLGCL